MASQVSYRQIVEQRYATKKFTGEKLPEDKVNELLEIIRLSASSYGIQPWKIKVVMDQETKDKLQAASWNQPQVGTASHVLVFCADVNLIALIDKLEGEIIKSGVTKEQIAGYVKMMKDFASSMSEEQKLNWAQKQVYIALCNALNGAKALGFDSCPMEGFSPKDYSEILKLPKHLVPTVVVPIGIAADSARPKTRFPLKDILI